jgi:hypothetical protein
MAICDKRSRPAKLILPFSILTLILFTADFSANGSEPFRTSEQVYDFGYVGIDYRIFHNYVIVNTSRKDIRIDSVDVLCDCSSVIYDKKVLKPGDSVLLKLTFDTKDFYGPVNRKLNVFLSIPEKRVISFFYLAEVGQWKNGLKPHPFAVFLLPNHKQQSIKITNRVFESIEAHIHNKNDDYFNVEIPKGGAKQTEELEIVVKPGDNLNKGTYLSNFTLKITTDDPENPAFLTIPVKIARF